MNNAIAVTALLRRCKVAFTFLEQQDDGRVLVHVPTQKTNPHTTIHEKLYKDAVAGTAFAVTYGFDVASGRETFLFTPRKE